MSLFLDLLGWAGAAALLYGYAMVSMSRMSGDGMPYQVTNLVGAVALMVNSAYHAAWPSAILNVVWGVIGLVAIGGMVATRTRRGEVSVP
ncbi:CBU_0592 family membrane protein [Streptosporangium sp. DT93]|uniref:CBU_0592 family membrane protein n=1 Tax=Streptosporangium sp. DT93 TaxID=3393428 RepID=UPI003CFB65E9